MTGAELTSTRSARVTAARRLAKRAARTQQRLFLAEGPQAVREAVVLPGVVRELFLTADAAQRHPDLAAAVNGAGAATHLVSGQVMEALAQTVTPPGVVAVCGYLDVDLDTVLAAEPRLVAVLAAVRDPGNAGTVIRVADAAGADAVVLTDSSVDVYNAKCVRATAGSLFHLPVVAGVPAGPTLGRLQVAGLRVLAADGAATEDLDTMLDSGALRQPTAWLFGNEAHGLPAELTALADVAVRVPIHGRAESLNLATAAAVCLYASARTQRVSRS